MCRCSVGLLFLVLWAPQTWYSVCGEQSTRFQVQIPQSLSKPNGYEHEVLLWGQAYGAISIQHPLYHINSTLCNEYSFQIDRHGPFVLMIDRPSHWESCLVQEQLRHAQDSGAMAVIIVNDRCSSFNVACQIEAKEFASQSERMSMGDESSIPALLIYKEDADAIKHVIQNGNQVIVSMSFPMPSQQEKVVYELWTTPLDADAVTLLSDFELAASVLKEYAVFAPHMIVNRCPVGPSGQWRYCDPYYEAQVMSEIDSIRESLRRICLWRRHRDKDGFGRPWWDYVNGFATTCPGALSRQEMSPSECAHMVMNQNKIDAAEIDLCMDRSGGQLTQNQHTPNELLEEAVESANHNGKSTNHASLFVNSVKLHGSLSFENLFRAICLGFLDGSVPEVCTECVGQDIHLQSCVRTYQEDQQEVFTSAHDSVSLSRFVVSLVCLVSLLGVSTYAYMQRNRRFVHSHVTAILAEYVPLPAPGDAA